MFVRHGLFVGSIAIASLALAACGAPPDGVGKDGKGIGGSPNDPGWTPPGANNGPSSDNGNPQPGDDQGEQPTGNPPGNCSPMGPATIPDGWSLQDFTTLSVAVPSTAEILPPCDHDPMTCPSGVLFQALMEGKGSFEARETIETSLDADVATYVSDISEGDPPSKLDVTNEVFGCDRAKLVHAVGAQGEADLFLLAVLHAGHVFEARCFVRTLPDGKHDTSMCTTYLSTFRTK